MANRLGWRGRILGTLAVFAGIALIGLMAVPGVMHSTDSAGWTLDMTKTSTAPAATAKPAPDAAPESSEIGTGPLPADPRDRTVAALFLHPDIAKLGLFPLPEALDALEPVTVDRAGDEPSKVGTITGRVSGVGGGATAGALLIVAGEGYRRAARAGEDGAFSLERVPEGAVSVLACAPDGSSARARVRVSEGQASAVDLTLKKPCRVVVRTVELQDEEVDCPPVAGARVLLFEAEFGYYVEAASDKEGRAVFPALPTARYQLKAEAAKHLPWGVDSLDLMVDLETEIALEPAVPARLVVRDERGHPIRGVTVWRGLADESYAPGWSRKVSVTDRDGAIDTSFDWSGTSARLFLTKEGYGIGVAEADNPMTDELITAVLGVGADLDVTVRDGAGRPVPDTLVRIRMVPADHFSPEFSMTVHTDSNGRFAIADAPLGTARLEVDGWSIVPRATREVRIWDKNQPLSVEVRVERQP